MTEMADQAWADLCAGALAATSSGDALRDAAPRLAPLAAAPAAEAWAALPASLQPFAAATFAAAPRCSMPQPRYWTHHRASPRP